MRAIAYPEEDPSVRTPGETAGFLLAAAAWDVEFRSDVIANGAPDLNALFQIQSRTVKLLPRSYD